MRTVYVVPRSPIPGAVLVLIIVGLVLYRWLLPAVAGGLWIPLNPFIYGGSFLLAGAACLALLIQARSAPTGKVWARRAGAALLALGWVGFVVDHASSWPDTRAGQSAYAVWDEMHQEPRRDGADLQVLAAISRTVTNIPVFRDGVYPGAGAAAFRAWQDKAISSAEAWHGEFLDGQYRAAVDVAVARTAPYLWFWSLLSGPMLRHPQVGEAQGGACRTYECIARTDVACTAMFSDPESLVGRRAAPTMFVNREFVLSTGPEAVASTRFRGSVLKAEGLRLLQHPPRWLGPGSNIIRLCRSRFNMQ